jgi:hypothetical protein
MSAPPPRPDVSPNRRDLLRAALSAGGALGLAGCSSFGRSGPPDRQPYDVPDRTPTESSRDGRDRPTAADPADVVAFGSVPVPDPGPAWYRRYLPNPLLLSDEEGYRFDHFDLRELREAGATVPTTFQRHRRRGRFALDDFGVGFERFERALRFPDGSAVVEGRFDASAVAGHLASTGYDDAGIYRRWRLFEREDAPRSVAVADGELVWGTGVWDDPLGGSPRSFVEAVADARDGEGPRYADADVAMVTTAAGGPPSGTFFDVGGGGPGVFDLETARAWSTNVSFGERPVLWVVVAVGEADAGTVEGRIRESLVDLRVARGAEAAEVTVGDGSATMALVPGTGWPRAGRAAVLHPQVTWGYDHDPEAGTLTVVHEAGDDLPTDRLYARGPFEGVAFPDGETFGAGDRTTVDLRRDRSGADREVLIYWSGGEVPLPGPLGRYRLPPADAGDGTGTGTATTTGTDA